MTAQRRPLTDEMVLQPVKFGSQAVLPPPPPRPLSECRYGYGLYQETWDAST